MCSRGRSFACPGAPDRRPPPGERGQRLCGGNASVRKHGVLEPNPGGFWKRGTTSPMLSPSRPPGTRHGVTEPGGAQRAKFPPAENAFTH